MINSNQRGTRDALLQKDGKMISVIVPIYNVKKYLERCVQSIMCQTYKNLEIILVDDGSSDGSGEICDTLGRQDERIRVIHQENRGLSEARNCALNIAKGDYIAFVDSDDFIAENMYEMLLNKIHQYDADMVICGYSKWFEKDGTTTQMIPIMEECVLKREDVYEMHFQEDKSVLLPVAWNKLYKKSLWQNIRYPKGKYHEDEYVIHHLVHLCENIAMIPECYYYYSIRQNSIMAGRNIKKSRDWIYALMDRKDFFEEESYIQEYHKQSVFCIRMILWECKKIEAINDETKAFMYEMAGCVKSIIHNIQKGENINRKALFFAMFPVFYTRCSKFLEKTRQGV